VVQESFFSWEKLYEGSALARSNREGVRAEIFEMLMWLQQHGAMIHRLMRLWRRRSTAALQS
jgi:hypothetical protein